MRIDFFGDEVERIIEIDPLTGEVLAERDAIDIYPAKHFVTSQGQARAGDRRHRGRAARSAWRSSRAQGKILEAARLEERTRYDIEMLREAGYCSGIENYSPPPRPPRRPASRRGRCSTTSRTTGCCSSTSRTSRCRRCAACTSATVARKEMLVDFGFRLPSALDNRPLNFDEFEDHIDQVIYVSATPGPVRARAQSSRSSSR